MPRERSRPKSSGHSVQRRSRPKGANSAASPGGDRSSGQRPSQVESSPDSNASSARRASVRIRMYRQGLGDCFLLTFPRTEGGDYHVLIDCGVIVGTANAAKIMKEVVDDIARTTSKRVDLLIVTHEHWDHISGFDPSARLFEGFTFLEVWLGWTEDPQDRVATWLRAERAQRLSALQLGFTKLASLFGQRGATAEELEVVERSRGVLGFFGIDEDSRPETRPARGKAANEGLPSENRCGRTMRWLREESSRNVKYRRPGEEVVLTRASGVRVFVLGPPTDLSLLRKDLPTRSGKETYELGGRLGVAETAFFAAIVREGERGIEFEASRPFDPKYRIDFEDARNVEFFRDHYFGSGPADESAMLRRISDEAIQGAAELALQLDSDTNNTSLALAFELPDGKVLLFPGDAQVGNWESWHVADDGGRRIWNVDGREVTAESLLRRTVVYKVAHHGSHNATLREKGLELMTHPELVALLPVDVHTAHHVKKWLKMPFAPLVNRIRERSHHRVLIADTPLAESPTAAPDQTVGSEIAGRLDPGLLDHARDAIQPFSTSFVSVTDRDQPGPERPRPLYVELEIAWPR